MLVIQFLLLGVCGVVVASTPAGIHLHVQLLLLASHLVVLGLLRPVQRVPLSHTQAEQHVN